MINIEPKNSVAACTIVSRNYAAYAATLQASFRESNPNIDLYVLIVDRFDPAFSPPCRLDGMLWVEDLAIPGFTDMSFKFDILELNTNVKPFMLERLCQHYETVFYFDPDIFVFQSIQPLVDALKDRTAIITPHTISPIWDNHKPGEVAFHRSGIYNLGFIGVRSCEESAKLLRWWGIRCFEEGFNDPRQGQFVDQRFIDMAPALFSGVHIERSPAYNVAYWNLHERVVDTSGPIVQVNGIPLVFFHFSGLSVDPPTEPRLEISKYQDRADFSSFPSLKPLFTEYRAKLVANGHRDLRSIPYSFGTFSDGQRINSVSRRLYSLVDDRDSMGDPFNTSGKVYGILARLKALEGKAETSHSTFTIQRTSFSVRLAQGLLRFGFRVLGPVRYNTLMTYFGHVCSIRNQREVFFGDR